MLHAIPDSLQSLDHRGPDEVLLLDGRGVRQHSARGTQAQNTELPPRLLRVSEIKIIEGLDDNFCIPDLAMISCLMWATVWLVLSFTTVLPPPASLTCRY